jgi:hypothetical protein
MDPDFDPVESFLDLVKGMNRMNHSIRFQSTLAKEQNVFFFSFGRRTTSKILYVRVSAGGGSCWA